MGVQHPGVAAVTLGPGPFGVAGVIRITPPPANVMWRIHQLAISCDPPGNLTLDVRMGPFQCMTPGTYPSGVAAQGEPPIDIVPHDELVINITLGPYAAKVTAAYYYEELPIGS